MLGVCLPETTVVVPAPLITSPPEPVFTNDIDVATPGLDCCDDETTNTLECGTLDKEEFKTVVGLVFPLDWLMLLGVLH